MIKQNIHTHSTYADGRDTLEQMVLAAIEQKFTVLGFSEHAYIPGDDCCMSPESTEQYIAEVRALAEKYKEQITIFLGLEQDMRYRDWHPDQYDYMLGSKHYLEHDGTSLGIDSSPEVFTMILQDWYHNDFMTLAKDYYTGMRDMADWKEVDIIAHLDLLMKYNEDQSFFAFDDPKYINLACDTIDALSNKIFEVNTGAIARGYRKTPYPEKHLLEYMYQKGIQICLNSDCHNSDYLSCGFEEALKLIQSCGYKEMVTLTKNGFKSVPISLFQY